MPPSVAGARGSGWQTSWQRRRFVVSDHRPTGSLGEEPYNPGAHPVEQRS